MRNTLLFIKLIIQSKIFHYSSSNGLRLWRAAVFHHCAWSAAFPSRPAQWEFMPIPAERPSINVISMSLALASLVPVSSCTDMSHHAQVLHLMLLLCALRLWVRNICLGLGSMTSRVWPPLRASLWERPHTLLSLPTSVLATTRGEKCKMFKNLTFRFHCLTFIMMLWLPIVWTFIQPKQAFEEPSY